MKLTGAVGVIIYCQAPLLPSCSSLEAGGRRWDTAYFPGREESPHETSWSTGRGELPGLEVWSFARREAAVDFISQRISKNDGFCTVHYTTCHKTIIVDTYL